MSYRRRYSPPAANSTSCVPRSTSRPSASTTIKSAWRTVARRCAITSTVRCAIRRSIASCTRRSDSVSRALVAGEPRAALAQQGVVGLRELGDELVRVRGAGGAAYLLEREVATAVRDVRIHRVVEQHGLL